MLTKTLQLLRIKSGYIPLNTVYISKHALQSNLSYLQSMHPNTRIAPVLKSNAYGHGLIGTAKILDTKNCPFFCVDSLYEAYTLKQADIKTPILILGYVDPDNLKYKKLPFQYVVSDPETLRLIHQYQPQAGIHIEVNTGMNRLGIAIEALPNLITTAQKLGSNIVGCMSHFAHAEDPSSELTTYQIAQFEKAVAIFQAHGINPPYTHLAASAAFFTMPNLPYTMARIGKALYGLEPLGKHNELLKPAVRVTSKLVQIHELKEGEYVGYGGTFKAPKQMLLGIVPLGYFEGLDRRLSNKGSVSIRGTVCPIIGRISMNITTIDISAVKTPIIGDEIVIFSDNPSAPNSFHNAAKTAETIAHELLVHITPSIRRTYIDT